MHEDQISQILTTIAQKSLKIETLETRMSDGLDFHDIGVWCLKDALLKAFEAGLQRGQASS